MARLFGVALGAGLVSIVLYNIYSAVSPTLPVHVEGWTAPGWEGVADVFR